MVLIRNTPLDPLDRGFCKHALHGRVLCGITPCWHRGQTGGLFILSILNLKLFRLQITLGLKSPTGSFGGHVQGGSLVDATFLEALQIQPPHTVCTEPTSLSSSPYHGVTAWLTTGDRSRKTRINSYQLPWRISMQEKGQWGWKIRQKLPTEQRWCVLETGIALRSVSSPPHPWPVSSLLMDSRPGRCLPPSQHTPRE